jgi:gliding motility-associated-like protein
MLKHLFFILLIPTGLFAQKQNNNWFFGTYLGMKFDGGNMSIVPPQTSKMYAPYGCTSYSDPSSGALLFYTNGAYVYNRFHQQMPNGFYINNETFGIHTMIVPVPGSTRFYYIFASASSESKLYYCKVDMQLDNGKGDIIENRTLLGDFFDLQFTVVKQYYDNGYWLITHKVGTNEFYSYSIDKNGVSASPVSSIAGRPSFPNTSYVYGKMVASSDGEQFVMTTGIQTTDCFAQMFQFDKRCGKVTAGDFLEPRVLQGYPVLAFPAFSPDNHLVYISWYYNTGQNFLLQYNLFNRSAQTILTSFNNEAGDMQVGPDNKLYVTSAENGAVTPKISVINKPNEIGAACDFKLRSINLGTATSYFTEHFPTFIMDISEQKKGYAAPRIKVQSLCLGTKTSIKLKDSFVSDSFKWELGDGTVSKLLKTEHTYSQAGKYSIIFNWYVCGKSYFTCDTIVIGPKPIIDLGPDTILCAGASIKLNGPKPADEYKWSTGETTDNITVQKEGSYTLTVSNGGCSASDDIAISHYPSLWTVLGDEYFICDDEKELTKLDAGEGFTRYKWTPTGDTTQWIKVALLGEYFVVVEDFRGCKGEDGTKVKRRCPVKVYFPNVFTPNSDGLNDAFEPIGKDVTKFSMTVYNGWGEVVFVTDDISHTWDGTHKGKPSPAGVYIYKSYYEGYRNKKITGFDVKGNLTLLR